MLSCIIVDDELMARQPLERLCEQHSALRVLASFDSATTALDFLMDQPVDLIWLDVEMPGLSGFDLLEQLPSIPFVVLTTSKTEYAFDAFQYQVTDYLQKPISLPRFKICVEKILELSAHARASLSTEREEIYVKTDGRYIRLSYDSISYIEGQKDYIMIFTKDKGHLVYATMKSVEEKLGDQFMRVHRSFIVRLDSIVDIEENTLVIGKKVIPIARSSKAELMSRLNFL